MGGVFLMPRPNPPVILQDGRAVTSMCATHGEAALTMTLECAGFLARVELATLLLPDSSTKLNGPPLCLSMTVLGWGRTSRPMPSGRNQK